MTAQNNLEENKRIVRAFIEAAFNQHQADRAADYMTSDIKWHGGTLGTVEGRENFAGLIGAIVSALPDLRNAVVEGTQNRSLRRGFPSRVLTGWLEDRSALFGVIVQIEGLGLELLEVRQVRTSPQSCESDDER